MTTKTGFFKPKNIKKYDGDPTQICYRSSWENTVMKWLDRTDSVIEWSSEEVIVPYISPLDNRRHRYFPDFKATIKDAAGNIKTYMIEVKPEKQTKPPNQPKRQTKRYLEEVATWGINSAKWKSAREYCEKKGWEFLIITEKTIPH